MFPGIECDQNAITGIELSTWELAVYVKDVHHHTATTTAVTRSCQTPHRDAHHTSLSSHPSISSHTTLLCNTHPASRTHRYDTRQPQGVEEKDRAGCTRYARSFFFFSFFTNYVHDSATPTPSHRLLADTPHPVHQAHTPCTEHEEHILGDVFFMFGSYLISTPTTNTKNTPPGCVFCVCRLPHPAPH